MRSKRVVEYDMGDQSLNTEELMKMRLRPAPIVKMLVVTDIVASIIICIYAALLRCQRMVKNEPLYQMG